MTTNTSQINISNVSLKEFNLRDAQGMARDSIKLATQLSRKGTRAYIGLLGLAFDEAKNALANSETLLSKAEERGAQVETELSQQMRKLEAQAAQEMKKWSGRAKENVDDVTSSVTSEVSEGSSKVYGMVERRLEDVLSRFGIPSRNRVEAITQNIEVLTERIEEELAAVKSSATAAAAITEPFSGYDELSVKAIVGKLQSLSTGEVAAIHAYEVANKNRVTLLRAVTEILEEKSA